MDSASLCANKTVAELASMLGDRCSFDDSQENESARRERRYLVHVSSSVATDEALDRTVQQQALALCEKMDNAHRDVVANAIRESIQRQDDTFENLPWHILESAIKSLPKKPLAFTDNARLFTVELPSCRTPVVVKVYNSNVDWSEEGRKRFVSKMNLWGRLDHPNLRKLHGTCYLAAKPMVVMERLNYRSFCPRFRGRALHLLAGATQGVVVMHASGIVHGDFKCDNIFGTDQPTPLSKVCNFGYAFDWAALKAQGLEHASAASAGIETSRSTKWLAPECVAGRLPSPTADVYAFGMTIYEALTQKAPYYHVKDSGEVQMYKFAHELPAHERDLIELKVWDLIKQTSCPDPQQRPTMREVMLSLKALAEISGQPSI